MQVLQKIHGTVRRPSGSCCFSAEHDYEGEMASIHRALCTVTEDDDDENTRGGGWLPMPLWQSAPLLHAVPMWQADAAGA